MAGNNVTREECAICHRHFALRKDGNLRPHGLNRHRCSGSWTPPAGRQRTAGVPDIRKVPLSEASEAFANSFHRIVPKADSSRVSVAAFNASL